MERNIPVDIINVRQVRRMEYERDAATGQILVSQPKVSRLHSTLTLLLLPTGETIDLVISNETAEQILRVCPAT